MNKNKIGMAVVALFVIFVLSSASTVLVSATQAQSIIKENFDNTSPFPGKYTYSETDVGGKLRGKQDDNANAKSGTYSFLLFDDYSPVRIGDNQAVTVRLDFTNIENIYYTVWVKSPSGGFGQTVYVKIDNTIILNKWPALDITPITRLGDFENSLKSYGLTGYHDLVFLVYFDLNRAGGEAMWIWIDNVATDDNTPTPIKGLGKPGLLIPENGRQYENGDNIAFEWYLGENAENSRLEVFNGAGVCVDNQTKARPDNTYSKAGGYSPDNYTYRVWAENRNLASGNQENVSADTYGFEVLPTPIPPAAPETLTTINAIIFLLPLILMYLAAFYDSSALCGLGGIAGIFAGIYFIDSVWAGLAYVGLGIYFLYSATNTE